MKPYFDYPIELQQIGVAKFQHGMMLVDTEKSDSELFLTLSQMLALPYSVYLLDMTGATLLINEVGAKICGFNKPEFAQGKTIFHVSGGNAAKELLDNCESVLKQESVKVFDEFNLRFDGRFLQFLSIKFPCYDSKGKLQGILGISIVLGEHSLAESIMNLTDLGLLPKNAGSKYQSIKLNLCNVSLTSREQECLDLTVKGYTAKQIAKELSISPRTVEEYLTQLKLKFEVSSKQQLIQKVLN